MKKNKKVYHKILNYRIFENSECVKEFMDIFGKAFSEPPRLFKPTADAYINHVSKNFALVHKGNRIEILNKGLGMGFIQETSAGNTQFYFDKVPPQSKISRSFLGIKGEQYRDLIIENYIGKNLVNPSLQDLVSRVRSSIGAVKRKKQYGYVPMETFEEFYVMERFYLQQMDIDRLRGSFSKSIYLDNKSSYNDKFWLILDQYNIPSLPINMLKQKDSKLIEK